MAQECIEGPKRSADTRALDRNATAQQRQHGSTAFDRREQRRLPQTPIELFERRERQGRRRGKGAFADQRACSLKRLVRKLCSVIVAAVGRKPRGGRYRPGCLTQRLPGVMAQLGKQGADDGMRGAGGEGGLLRGATDPCEPVIEPHFGIGEPRLQQRGDQCPAQQVHAKQSFFVIGEARGQPVEPPQNKRAGRLGQCRGTKKQSINITS